MGSPTQRSLKLLRDSDWDIEVVEKWIPGANIRRDLFGIIDLLGVKGMQTLGVQTTSYSNLSARLKKMGDSPMIGKLREAGWLLEAHGWKKNKAGKWEVKVVDVS